MTAFSQIPVLGLAGWRDQPGLPERFVRICHEVGFLSVVDHDVPKPIVERYFDALQSFFALPAEVKETIDKRRSPYFRGWERVGAELTDNRVDFREQLDLSTEYPPRPSSTEPAYLRLDGPNQWLPEEVLPGFRATVTDFIGRLAFVADEVMQVLAVGLGLAPLTFREIFGERPLSLAKLISYPPTPLGQAGVNSHHDAGFLTVLLQHGVGGLQAQNADGDWIDVPPTPGAFVINLGELLQAMTGNYLVATTHRVVSAEQRFSSAYFHGPDLRTPITPLELEPRFREAVAASPRHREAGFMARRDELLAGQSGTRSAPVTVYGQMLWNYYSRSYPEIMAAYHVD